MSFAVPLRRLPLIAGVALLFVAFTGLALAGKSASADTSVEAGNDYFCSADFEGSVCETDITAGETVTWNVVAGSHTVTECSAGFASCPPAGGFDSDILVDGDTYSHTFSEPGTYPYRCQLHPSEMLGTIVVAAAATDSPTPAASETAPASASATPTAVVLPSTGGAPSSGDPGWAFALLGAAVLAASGAAFTLARRRALS